MIADEIVLIRSQKMFPDTVMAGIVWWIIREGALWGALLLSEIHIVFPAIMWYT